ncbi:MexW/MexI family multidrug efflux RND transporter permease subunit [Sansalvadorimonas sp. 2012CJ34-2]|uniref:MexW/MexI family multidrug efflux RND transporter permease subunit n=1 Tax=Parendozoicomonas callyspongiae TaxID=2942213 RepID=A0ABT0PEQ4_9GAMM|nr:MexW/MexI family multidrug efflux RND transporter permease subunit [Sansalvadorimonas sp. 2012CJ34-2]MCL6269855.1 MexW/MexI family multidrug efflux RND transporter permease subunit [Sansalvadorimonas sp. 2012CJ34-2]
MKFTDLFIRRPVLATVVSLLIVLLGLQALNKLPVREYPDMEDAVVTVTTFYPGANAELIQGFITTPVQQAIASAEGIEYITSSSNQSSSTVTAHLRLGYSADTALTEIMSKVNEVRSQLPQDAEDPVITKGSNQGSALVYLSFYSDRLNSEQVTDYLTRVVQPQLATLEGVGEAEILGQKTFAMRIWLDPVRMAAYRVTAADVNQALLNSNVQSAAGQTRGELVVTSVNAKTDLTSPEQFNQIVVRSDGDSLVRLEDVADVELSAENFNSYVAFNGKPSIYIGVSATPSANPLDVIKRLRDYLPTVQKQLPTGMQGEIVYDATEFIQESIDEVVKTLLEATVIVILVVFLFLGSFRVVVIPIVAIPLSMIGVLFCMQMMGYSINLLTLLAMVLAIGLVVDDAIVVVENIHRHIEEGHKPLDAALMGAREIALPVIAMTITLAAVYAPIGFMEGLTGALFREFAFTLAGAVVVSGIVALTLSPVMCSLLLKPAGSEGAFAVWLDKAFDRLKNIYQRMLQDALKYRAVTLVFALIVLATIPPMYMMTKKELAPQEDNGLVFIVSTSPQYANIDYMNKYTAELEPIFNQFPEYFQSFLINGSAGVNTGFAGMVLKPWNQRERSVFEIQKELQGNYLSRVTGIQTFSFIFPSLPGSGGGLPVQFILNTTSDYRTLANVANQIVGKANQSGLFMFAESTLRINKPETELLVDRNKAARLGISMKEISNTLSTMLGNGNINRFNIDGRSYKVIPQANQEFRLNKEWLGRYYVRNASGDMIPLSAIIQLRSETKPNQLTQFQQLNSTKIQGMLLPGVSQGEALAFLNEQVQQLAPEGFGVDYEGPSRQFMKEGQALLLTFVISLLVIYLVLAAQFESFRDPLVVMLTVPMSICGALIPLVLGNLLQMTLGINISMNIYTQIGLVTLIGLISKHGILIVEFANQLQYQGQSRAQAALESAALRLRPVLMTTGATVLGILPLLFASGAGAVSRFNIGLVITTGMTIGTLFTLFVIPVMYTFIAKEINQEETSEALPVT